MIETIPLDHIISFGVGIFMALTSSKQIKRKGLSGPHFKRAVLYQIFVFVVIGLYLATAFPAWSWMYYINPEEHSTLLTYGFVLNYFVAFIVGYLIGGVLILKDKIKIALSLLILDIIALIVYSGLSWERLMYVGGYYEFIDGFARSALKYPFFLWSMIIIGIYFFVPLIIVAMKNQREAQGLS